MISLFRKIRQKLLHQNRVTRYLVYAFGEIFLVVIGILIALQVNNWNETRKTQKKEQISLQKLAKNLQEDIDLLDEIIQEDSLIFETLGKQYDQILNAKSVEDLEPLGNSRFKVLLFYPNQSAYENLMSSGQLEIIQNDSLIQQLQRYYRSIKIIQEGTDLSLRNYSREIENFFLSFDHVRTHPNLNKKSISVYREDPFLLNSLYYKNGLVLIQIRNYSSLKETAQQLLSTVQNQLQSP